MSNLLTCWPLFSLCQKPQKKKKKAGANERPLWGEGKGKDIHQKVLWQISGSLCLAKNKKAKPQDFGLWQSFGGVFFEGKCLKMLPSFILPLLIWSEFFNQLKLSNCLKLFLTMMQMN